LSEKEFIPASEWRIKDTSAILNSIEMAMKVLEDRKTKFTDADKQFILELVQGLIDLVKPIGNCKER
jgi:hypothetical protein